MSGKLRQSAKQFAASTLKAAQPLRWAVQVKTTTDRETTGLVEVERVGAGVGYWVQVRNSVYLADNDLIWIVKDPSAQGNWTFDGFVEGAGTGESLNNSPIPSVQTPIVTSPDGTPLIIRPIAGQQGTIGRINETIDFPGAISVDQGVTFGALGAGIVQASAAGVLSSDYTIDATTTWATTTNIMPTDAAGQDLGDATHRWDLFTQGVIFGGASGANVITVPDTLADALHLVDGTTGLEFMRIVTTAAGQAVVFNNAEADIDFRVAASGVTDAIRVDGATGNVGIGVVPGNYHVNASNNTLSSTATFVGIFNSHTKTAGAGGAGDFYYGAYTHIRLNQATAIDFMYGTWDRARITAGTANYVWGGYYSVYVDGGTIAHDIRAAEYVANLDSGTVTGHVYGGRFVVDAEGGMTAIGGDIYGVQIFVDDDQGAVGTVYMLHLDERTGIDYGIYQASVGTPAPNYLGGRLAVGGTVGALAQLHMDQSAAGGAIPVAILDQGDVSEQHIVCTMSGADVDFPAILQLAVTGTPTLGWDETADEFTLSKGIQIAGNLTFTGAAAGLQFGEIYYHGAGFATTCTLEDTYYQVLGFDTDGEANGATPDHTNDHITIAVAGRYLISFSVSARAANADEYQFLVCYNDGPINGTLCQNIMAHRDISVAARLGVVACTGICDLPASATVELWVQNVDNAGRDIDIDHVTLNVVQIGGAA